MELCNLLNRILLIHGLLLLVDNILHRVDLLLVGLVLVFFLPWQVDCHE